MKKIFLIASTLILAGCTQITSNPAQDLSWATTQTNQITNKPHVCIQNTCFDTEIADTPQEREYGLMMRTSMPTQSGMLFVFEQEGVYSFWMKNTLIPLDMIWINAQNTIVTIEEADPCTSDPCTVYNKDKAASYVLEINKGLSKHYGFKIGDKVEITR